MATYVLDSFAVLAFLQKESGSASVKEILEKARRKGVTVFLSELSLGEVYYILIRALGVADANIALAHIIALPMSIVPVGRDDVLAAAQLKARGNISYADCFVVVLAAHKHATVVTGDREFAAFENLVKILWLV